MKWNSSLIPKGPGYEASSYYSHAYHPEASFPTSLECQGSYKYTHAFRSCSEQGSYVYVAIGHVFSGFPILIPISVSEFEFHFLPFHMPVYYACTARVVLVIHIDHNLIRNSPSAQHFPL